MGHDEFPDLNFRPGRQVGLIAQEVKEVLPEVVFEDSQGMQSVAYSAIIPVLIEAIKEQQQIIESLKEETRDLRRLIQAVSAQRPDEEKRHLALVPGHDAD